MEPLLWTVEVAGYLGIPRFVFNSSSYFANCAELSVEQNRPHQRVESDAETFVLPGLPHKIEMTKLQIMDYEKGADGFSQYKRVRKESEMKSSGVIFNSFHELEQDYEEYYKTVMGVKTGSIGPVLLVVHRDAKDKAQRANKPVILQLHECITWLNSKEHNLVLYVSSGYFTEFPTAQLLERAVGLGASHQ